MALTDFQPRWRVTCRRSFVTFGGLPHASDVLSGVSLRVLSTRCRACSKSTSAPHFAQHPLLHSGRVTLHAIAHLHAHVGVRSHVQMACPERAMPVAWLALAGWQAAQDAAPPGHRIPVPSGRGKMQGKIEGCSTTVRTKPVCTWVWGSTRPKAAACCPQPQRLAGIGNIVCRIRLGAMGLAGAAP